LVKWHQQGRELKALVEHKGHTISRHVPNEAYYFYFVRLDLAITN
jgi:hypothetical protein